MVATPIWGGWPRGILPPFLTSFYGNGRTKFPKKKLNDDSRRGDTKIGQSPSPRTSGANPGAGRPARLEQPSTGCKYIFGENGTLELRNSARIVQSLDARLVLLTR
jgi:hypothetical protein